MVSQAVIDVLGIIGGGVLAICQAPQLIKLWRTKSASDLSYWYLVLYSIGLTFITVYLYLEGATVGWICELLETVCGFLLIVAKYYLDEWGPLSWRAKRKRQQGCAAGSGSELGIPDCSGGSSTGSKAGAKGGSVVGSGSHLELKQISPTLVAGREERPPAGGHKEDSAHRFSSRSSGAAPPVGSRAAVLLSSSQAEATGQAPTAGVAGQHRLRERRRSLDTLPM